MAFFWLSTWLMEFADMNKKIEEMETDETE